MSKKNVLQTTSLKLDDVDSCLLLSRLCQLENDNFDNLSFFNWRFAAIRNLTDWAAKPTGNTLFHNGDLFKRYQLSRLVALVLANDGDNIVVKANDEIDERVFNETVMVLIRTFTVPNKIFIARHAVVGGWLGDMANYLGMGVRELISYQLVMLAINSILDDNPECKDVFYNSLGVHQVANGLVASLQFELAPNGYSDTQTAEYYLLKTIWFIDKRLLGSFDVQDNEDGDGVFSA